MSQGGYRRYDPTPGQTPIRTNLAWAIAALLICFWPAGIVAVVYALKSRSSLQMGDYAAAARYSRLAKRWCWISLASAFVLVIGLVIFERGLGSGGATTTLTSMYGILEQHLALLA